jgi:NTE family protein
VTVPEDVRRAVIAARLPVDRWPDRPFLVTAVDAVTGDRVTFGADAGVPLVDAVTASCAVPGVWPPVTLGGRRYVDGGVASLTNADLAAGSDRTVVLSPMERLSGGGDDPGGPGPTVPPRPLVVAADDAAVAAFGPNALDPACRVPALEAGLRQAASVAEAVAAYWAV